MNSLSLFKQAATLSQDLLTRIKSGDRRAITQLYENIFPKVQSWITNNSGTEADAHDVFQDSLETILLKVDKVHTSLEGLIITIAKRKWLDKLRKKSRRGEVRMEDIERLEGEETWSDDLVQKEQEHVRFQLLERSFQQLSELCKELLTKIKAGKKVEELMKEMNFNKANTLYRRKAACVERWSKLVKEDPAYILTTE